MSSTFNKWLPRTLAIAVILFMLLFSSDCFGSGAKLKQQLTCFFMHNIPVIILLVALTIAWFWEMIGGLLFMAASLAGVLFFRAFTGNMALLALLALVLLTGILFVLNGYGKSRKIKH